MKIDMEFDPPIISSVSGKFYPVYISDGDHKIFVWQLKPVQKIILNNQEITQEELIEKLKSLG